MQQAPNHPKETERLSALAEYEVLDSEDEVAFDELTKIASAICGTEICLISLIDHDRQWFKSRVGLDATETPRSAAFCSHAILQDGVFEVHNALKDERFHDNPLVTDPDGPGMRFYAGAPLVTESGLPLGTLCVIDRKPLTLNDLQKQTLKVLANQVIGQLELRIQHRRLQRISHQREQLLAVIAHDLRDPFNSVLGFSRRLKEKALSDTPERIASIADSILNSGHRVFQLLDELLQWSQLQMGSVRGRPKDCNLAELIQSNIELLQDARALKCIELSVNVPAELHLFVDSTLYGTVIRNVLANAIKFTPNEGRIIIESCLENDQVLLSISDTGLGISKEKADLLFSLPVSSEKGTSGEPGFGLGLKLCKEFIDLQGGEIWLDENYTLGTKIVFSIPN